jgi:glycosyltransferase involved in cell wall biosynthesis
VTTLVAQTHSNATTSTQLDRRVCLFISSFGDGGVERMLVNLAKGIDGYGVGVDLIVNQADSPYLDNLPPSIVIHEIKLPDASQRTRWLTEHLQRTRPDALLSAKSSDDRIALDARKLSGVDTPIYLRIGTNFSQRRQAQRLHPLRNWKESRELKRLFSEADCIIAVSRGVADDITRQFGVPASKTIVIPNPTVTPDIHQLAELPVDHPWLKDKRVPVILAIGRFSKAKDYPTLIRAFALMRRYQACQLILLGEGRKREQLLRLAASLHISDDLDLPGFDPNPYAYLKHADLFVLSSQREGSPNALVEALALGIPVVSTDCNSGPAEILKNGMYGPLVPVGDAEALSQAMQRTLANPPPSDFLRMAAEPYRYDKSAWRYLQAFGIHANCTR